METAEHREPYESRGSRTDLGAPGGESPPGDSTSKAVPANKAECRLWVQKGDDCRNAPQRTRRAVSRHSQQVTQHSDFGGREPTTVAFLPLGLSGEKDVDVEGNGEGVRADIEARWIDMAGVGTHQDHRPCHGRMENRAAP